MSDMTETTGRVVQHAGLIDWASAGVVAATLFNHVPAAAALLAVLWYMVQLWESKTGEAIRHRVRRFLLRRGPF